MRRVCCYPPCPRHRFCRPHQVPGPMSPTANRPNVFRKLPGATRTTQATAMMARAACGHVAGKHQSPFSKSPHRTASPLAQVARSQTRAMAPLPSANPARPPGIGRKSPTGGTRTRASGPCRRRATPSHSRLAACRRSPTSTSPARAVRLIVPLSTRAWTWPLRRARPSMRRPPAGSLNPGMTVKLAWPTRGSSSSTRGVTTGMPRSTCTGSRHLSTSAITWRRDNSLARSALLAIPPVRTCTFR